MPFCEMRFGRRPAMCSPLNRMRPEVGRTTPVRQLKNVLLPAPFGPMMARISPFPTSKLTRLSAVRPPKRTVKSSVRSTGVVAVPRSGLPEGGDWRERSAVTKANLRPVGDLVLAPPWPWRPGRRRDGQVCGHSRELASRWDDRLLLRDHVEDAMLAVLDVEAELAQERLVVLLAEQLVALREVVALLHLEPFERLDQLHGVLAALEAGLFHADLEGVHRLVVRLRVAVGQRPRGVDLLEAHHRVVEELLVVRGIE